MIDEPPSDSNNEIKADSQKSKQPRIREHQPIPIYFPPNPIYHLPPKQADPLKPISFDDGQNNEQCYHISRKEPSLKNQPIIKIGSNL